MHKNPAFWQKNILVAKLLIYNEYTKLILEKVSAPSIFTQPITILHSSLFILHSSLFTLHSSLFTLHSSLKLTTSQSAKRLPSIVSLTSVRCCCHP